MCDMILVLVLYKCFEIRCNFCFLFHECVNDTLKSRNTNQTNSFVVLFQIVISTFSFIQLFFNHLRDHLITVKLFPQCFLLVDFDTQKSNISFREWRHFSYEPKSCGFYNEAEKGCEPKDVSSHTLPQFSSARAPKVCIYLCTKSFFFFES